MAGGEAGVDEIRQRALELGQTLREAADLVGAYLRAGKRQQALTLLADWTEGMREIAGHVESEFLREGLAEVNEALEDGDMVRVADALHHVVVPALDGWLQDAAAEWR